MTQRTYKIISFNETTGQISATVDGYTPLMIDLPIQDGSYLTGAELDQYILGFFPPVNTERKIAIESGILNVSVIAAMVEQPTQEQIDSQNNIDMLSQMHFEKSVAKALVKFGVLQSDPTAVEVTQL